MKSDAACALAAAVTLGALATLSSCSSTPPGALPGVSTVSLATPAASADPAPPREPCDQLITTHPGDWAARLRAVNIESADALEHYDELLAELQLEPLSIPPELAEDLEGRAPQPTLESVTTVETTLAAGREHIVAVAVFDLRGIGFTSRVQVLEKRGREGSCVVPGLPQREPKQRSCLSDNRAPLRVSPLRLVSKHYDSLQFTLETGSCGNGTLRGAHHEVELWGLEDGQLQKYLTLLTFEGWYTSPIPPLEETDGRIHFEGEPPRAVVHELTVSCNRHPQHDPDQDCTESETTQRYEYESGGYVPH